MKWFRLSIATLFLSIPTAHADLVGGVMLTLPEWNADATATLGEPTQVYRLFAAFDRDDEELIGILPDTLIELNVGVLFQDPLGGDSPPSVAVVEAFPSVRWDTYVAAGNLHNPSEFFFAGPVIFTDTSIQTVSGSWQVWSISDQGLAMPPGARDTNGEVVIPTALDDRFYYVFCGQFTVQRSVHEPVSMTSPAHDLIWSDVFAGQISIGHAVNQSGNTVNEMLRLAPTGCPGDMNNDFIVNGVDLAALLSQWNGNAGAFDPSGNDVVDGADLATLLGRWGGCLPE